MDKELESVVYYPKVIEHFASRNFNIRSRVKAFFKGDWFRGTVVKKYKKEGCEVPYILIKTDKRVDDEPDAFLGGFGLEGKVSEPCTIFEHEHIRGDKIYRKTYEREMTDIEKEEQDNLPF